MARRAAGAAAMEKARRIVCRQLCGEERFAFDPAHNLLPGKAQGQGSAGRVERNRLLVFEDQRFSYDSHGRMVTKLVGAHTQLQLHWNAEHQLQRSVLQRRGQAAIDTGYAYDPFGRRLYKAPLDADGRPISTHATWFVWDGNRLLQELKIQAADDDKVARSLSQTYVYEPESFVPLAQVRAVEDMDPPASAPTPPKRVRVGQSTAISTRHSPAELRYYHCDQIGTPRELTTADGRITWQASYKAWGNTAAVQWDELPAAADMAAAPAANSPQWQESNVDSSGLQPLRFQGQYFDVETGLHYNRFRYYDPACGRFASQDPIGLVGGENTFEYVANPSLWIDPLGLASYPLPAISGFQQHHIIPQKLDGSNIFALEQAKKAGFDANDQSNIIYLPCRRDKAKPSSMTRTLHRGSHPAYTKVVEVELGAIEGLGKSMNWSPAQYRGAVEALIKAKRADLRKNQIRLNNAC